MINIKRRLIQWWTIRKILKRYGASAVHYNPKPSKKSIHEICNTIKTKFPISWEDLKDDMYG